MGVNISDASHAMSQPNSIDSLSQAYQDKTFSASGSYCGSAEAEAFDRAVSGFAEEALAAGGDKTEQKVRKDTISNSFLNISGKDMNESGAADVSGSVTIGKTAVSDAFSASGSAFSAKEHTAVQSGSFTLSEGKVVSDSILQQDKPAPALSAFRDTSPLTLSAGQQFIGSVSGSEEKKHSSLLKGGSFLLDAATAVVNKESSTVSSLFGSNCRLYPSDKGSISELFISAGEEETGAGASSVSELSSVFSSFMNTHTGESISPSLSFPKDGVNTDNSLMSAEAKKIIDVMVERISLPVSSLSAGSAANLTLGPQSGVFAGMEIMLSRSVEGALSVSFKCTDAKQRESLLKIREKLKGELSSVEKHEVELHISGSEDSAGALGSDAAGGED